MSLTANQVLQGRYEVVRSIKSGGMGAVYEAIDRNLAQSRCAIKEVLAEALTGPDADYVLQTFEKEMTSLANLDHPNIPRVRDYFETNGRRYIVLDYVQGKPLDDELQEHVTVTGQPMDPHVAVMDMISVLETLSYLHGQRPPLVHRDIKPANLIRDERSGRLKLVDFGIARSVESQQVQTQVGTPGFCAPEQMAGQADVRSDLFSVGATLYQLVTGKLPPPFAFDALQPDLPRHPGLAAIINKATAFKPAERYQTAEEMARALRNWAQGAQALSQSLSPASVRSQDPPAPPVTRLNPLARPAEASNANQPMLVAAIVAVLVAAWALFPRAPEAPVPAASPPVAAASPAQGLPETAPSQEPEPTAPSPRATPKNTTPPPATRPSVPARPLRLPLGRKIAHVVQRPHLPGENYPQTTYPTSRPGRNRMRPAPAETLPAQELPEAPSSPSSNSKSDPFDYARREGLENVGRLEDGTLFRLNNQAEFRVHNRNGQPARELVSFYKSHFPYVAEGTAVRDNIPNGQYCLKVNESEYVHVKDGVMIKITARTANPDWGRIQQIVDNWPGG